MRGAIVTFSKEKPLWLMRKLQRQTLQLPVAQKQCELFILPYTEDEFARFSLRKQAKLLRVLSQRLQKEGVACLHLPPALTGQLEGNFFIPDGRRIFCAVAGHIIDRYYQAFSLLPEDVCVCVYENPFTQAGIAVAQQLCMRTKQLVLVSEDVAGATHAAELLFSEYGLAAQVTCLEKQMNKGNIVVLLSKPKGELLSAGLVLDYTGKYPFRAQRDYDFETAFGYASVLPYLGRADCRSGEFMLLCCDAEAENLLNALGKIGWWMKKT